MSRDWLDKNFYAILGVPQNASTDDIKKAYKKLARENHPDLNPGDPEAEKKFKEVSEANAVIGDERKRQEYDQMRSMGASGFGGFSSQGFTVDDFGDIFENLGDIFGFGGRRKGQTYQTNINISFLEAASGIEVVLPLESDSLKIKVPAGVDNGSVIRLRGRGGPGAAGAPDGDLLVQVSVEPHKFFKRKNMDLILEVPLLFSEAALGASIKIPTLTKSVTLKIPSGTPSGKTFKIRGEGISPQGRRPGDLYVKVFITPPTNLSRSAKKHLEKFRDQFESGNSPREYLDE
uniref:MedDCM-OCT-S30-C92-cds20 n=1 Tax=Candidatus Actinomarina minuta TaxID=1389454 RepID=S5DNL5_9ACTN|nr:MedDCM-OCT-S30-C92-cds20 [Candidatus Actinomarina minuta]